MDEAFRAHYELGIERGRLGGGAEPGLELVRTLELLDRVLPPAPAEVLDVGGGPGAYASILARRGYRVRLVDVMPLHVEQAVEAGLDARVGDARALDEADASYDVVLLLGPLYHLVGRGDRLRALREARRVARPGGLVAAAAVGRFASLLDGLKEGFLAEAAFREIVERDLRDGLHLNPDPAGRPEWFTTAFFHTVEELEAEAREAGLAEVEVVGVEGPGWLFPRAGRDEALLAARLAERHPELRCVSSHLLALARA